MLLLLRKIRSNNFVVGGNMVILNVKLDNIFGFRDFEINFSYPKKIVNSMIPEEHLPGRPNFRYKYIRKEKF